MGTASTTSRATATTAEQACVFCKQPVEQRGYDWVGRDGVLCALAPGHHRFHKIL